MPIGNLPWLEQRARRRSGPARPPRRFRLVSLIPLVLVTAVVSRKAAAMTAITGAVASGSAAHAWSLTQEQAHVRSAPDADPETIVPAVNGRLRERLGISHSTIQVDHADCAYEDHR
jgi:hypothetical protein